MTTTKKTSKTVAKTVKPKTAKKTKKALLAEKENAEIAAMAAKIEAAAIRKISTEVNEEVLAAIKEEEKKDSLVEKEEQVDISSKPLVKAVKRKIKVKKITPESLKRAKKLKNAKRAKKKLTLKKLDMYENQLLEMRQVYEEQTKKLSSASFEGSDTITAEDGTAAFDRQFSLGLASSEGDILFEIDEALARIHERTYGSCEDCGCLIEERRLNAIPFARNCIKCQAKKERDAGIHYKPKM